MVLRRSAFVSTNIDDKAIAIAAKTGDNNIPKNGYKTPAATGINAAL